MEENLGFGALLLNFSDEALDPIVKAYIRKWDDPPTALQILEALDYCINGSLATGFIVAALQAVYAQTCEAERTTHEEVVKLATWRKVFEVR